MSRVLSKSNPWLTLYDICIVLNDVVSLPHSKAHRSLAWFPSDKLLSRPAAHHISHHPSEVLISGERERERRKKKDTLCAAHPSNLLL